MEQAIRILVMGITATVAIDLWATFANRVLGWPRTNWGLVGRWIGHMRDGQFTHVSIGSQPALGLGICASKAPRANLVRWQNLIIHSVFGVALYYSYQVSNALVS